MYLLDTDTLTHLHAGNSNVTDRLKSVADVEAEITIITKRVFERGAKVLNHPRSLYQPHFFAWSNQRISLLRRIELLDVAPVR
jgi:hypothetical protein